MKKTIFTWSILFLLADAHCGETQELMPVKPLEVMVPARKSPSSALWEGLSKDAKYYVNRHGNSRQKKLTELVSEYQIRNPTAILEWTGGLSSRYKIIIVTPKFCFWTAWDFLHDTGTSGQCELSETQSKELHERIGKLRHYEGEATGMICDRIVFFMTIYENNIPVHHFFSDIPMRKDSPEYSKQFTDLYELRTYISKNIVLLR